MLDESPHIAIADRKACPECGSLSRLIEEAITESGTTKEKIGIQAKRLGLKKPYFESVSGDELYCATGQWNKLEQVIDRENNMYREEIIDPTTGKIIRSCDEPLTDHQNRGSAKRAPPKGEPDA
jgi:hypothetical protein